MIRSMMSQTDLLLSFWGYALETAVFTLNRVSTKSVERTPYEIWTGKHPRLPFLKVWGCEAYVKHLMSNKLTPKSDKYFLWGIRGKLKDIIFIIKLRAKCLSLVMVFSWRKSFSLKESVGARCNLKKFKKHPKMFQHPLIPYRRYKMLYHQMLKHQPHVGL
jgi:hypothetical protein